MPYFFTGLKSALPIALGYLPLGFAYGLLAREAGISFYHTVLMSIIVYAGSAQFIAVSLLAASAAPVTIVFTVFLVNLRHLLMSASLVPYLNRFSTFLLALLSFELTDETFAVASSHYRANAAEPGYHLGLNMASHLAWVTASALGAAFGNLLKNPEAWGITFALPAMFIALLVLQLQDRKSLIVAGISGGAALAAALYLPGNWYIILATVIAASLGVILEQCRLI